METMSKLDYLMKTLNIQGKELARELMVDKTTVSKWRNNQRKLNYEGRYVRQLAEYLLNSDGEKKRQKIHQVLKSYEPEIDFQSKDQQIESLCLWLTEEEINYAKKREEVHGKLYAPKNGYNTSVSIFIGDKGIDEAIEYFLSYLLKLVPGKELYLVDYSGFHWTNGDESTDNQIRVNNFKDLVRGVLEYGHKLIVIDCDTDIYRPYRAIFRWLEIYLMDGVEVWSHPSLNDEQYHYTSFVMKDEIALQCISNDAFPDKCHGMMYKNVETIDFLSNSARGILGKSKKLIDTMRTEDTLAMIAVVENYLKQKNRIYMINPSLTLQNIDETLLQEILRENKVEESRIDDCLNINRKFKRLKKRCNYVAIHDLDRLEEMSQRYKTTDDNLSVLCRKKVVITRANLLKIIESIIAVDIKENTPIIFTSFKYLSYIPENLSIMVQDNCFVAAWNMNAYKKRMYCTDPQIISGFYRYMDDIWHMIPRVSKDVAWRNKQLKRLLDKVE